jgi:hypothetical protein
LNIWQQNTKVYWLTENDNVAPLETHQLDWRLQLAAKQTRAEREIQADAAPTHALTYFNFPFVKRPLHMN